jgi:CheY-like chemotaxis protein
MALRLDPEMEVRSAASGGEAMAMLAGGGWRPDALLLDMMMPGQSGAELGRAIRTLPGLEAVPLIFITARCRDSEIAQRRAEGAAAVIAKPFDPLELAALVRASLPAAAE